jgi:hypothetical protein
MRVYRARAAVAVRPRISPASATPCVHLCVNPVRKCVASDAAPDGHAENPTRDPGCVSAECLLVARNDPASPPKEPGPVGLPATVVLFGRNRPVGAGTVHLLCDKALARKGVAR